MQPPVTERVQRQVPNRLFASSRKVPIRRDQKDMDATPCGASSEPTSSTIRRCDESETSECCAPRLPTAGAPARTRKHGAMPQYTPTRRTCLERRGAGGITPTLLLENTYSYFFPSPFVEPSLHGQAKNLWVLPALSEPLRRALIYTSRGEPPAGRHTQKLRHHAERWPCRLTRLAPPVTTVFLRSTSGDRGTQSAG